MASFPYGIDVSSYQGTIAWPAVAADGYSFGIVKATGGTRYTNPTFRSNWLAIRAVGLTRGAYHFAFESSMHGFPGAGPEMEAEYFLDVIDSAGGTEPGDLLVLDIEDDQAHGNLLDWTLRWLRHVEARAGYKPLIYSGTPFLRAHGLTHPTLAEYPLWLAAYQATMPPAPPPWSVVSLWQYTSNGVVDGVATACDVNLFNGTAERLPLLGMPAFDGPQFVLGFAQLAQRLGQDVVGDPLENEHSADRDGHPIAHQLTTNGEMVYWHEYGRAVFYPAVT